MDIENWDASAGPISSPRELNRTNNSITESPWALQTWTDGVPGRLRLASIAACEGRKWTLLLWRVGGEGCSEIKPVPYRCGSWRCRRCSWVVARDDFRRVQKATLSRAWWIYSVLTFDPKLHAGHWTAYRDGSRLWDKRLRRRLERSYGRLDYLQTWERTQKGWPHMNLLIRSEALEEHVKSLPSDRPWLASGAHGAGRFAHRTRWRRVLASIAPQCGFGMRVWVEIVDSREAVSAYLVKIAQEISRARFKDGDQSPIGAPPHFRRLRASRGLLPPRTRVVYQERTDERTGDVRSWLAERPIAASSTYSGVLSPRSPAEFEKRAPGWATDVAEAWDFQANAWRRKRGRVAATYEVG